MAIFLYQTFPESNIIAKSSQTNDVQSSTPTVPFNSNGEQIFKQNCASCHAINKEVVGPALAGVLKRGPWAQDKKKIYAWIYNPPKFMAKNVYTQELKAKYGVMMPLFPNLSEKEIDEIFDYIKSGTPEVIVN